MRRKTAADSRSASEWGVDSSGSSGIGEGMSVSSASDHTPVTQVELNTTTSTTIRPNSELVGSQYDGLLSAALAETVVKAATGELNRLDLRPPTPAGDERPTRGAQKSRHRERGRGSNTSPAGESRSDASTTRFPGAQILNSLHRGFSRPNGGPNSSGDDTAADTLIEEIVVSEPPGRERHCPESTLADLFPNERPQRDIIDNMLREAFRRNIVADQRRASNQRPSTESSPTARDSMPKSPVGRPNADGPFCVMRKSCEHVSIYDATEIDKAHKSRELDPALKIFIVTRCVDESDAHDAQLANEYTRVTRQKQREKDLIKKEKVTSIFNLHQSSFCLFSSISRSNVSKAAHLSIAACRRMLQRPRPLDSTAICGHPTSTTTTAA